MKQEFVTKILLLFLTLCSGMKWCPSEVVQFGTQGISFEQFEYPCHKDAPCQI